MVTPRRWVLQAQNYVLLSSSRVSSTRIIHPILLRILSLFSPVVVGVVVGVVVLAGPCSWWVGALVEEELVRECCLKE